MYIILLCLLFLYMLENIKLSYAFAGILEEKIKNGEKFFNISFFRTNESYSSKKELEKLIGKKSRLGREKMLASAGIQEELNNSKRVHRIKKNQKIKEMRKNIKNGFKEFKFRDFITLFIYVVLPFAFLILLRVPQIYSLFTKLISVVAEHRVDIYLSQLSLTFITISLMSIFSDSNAIILWENIVKKTLIEPPTSCFKAYFTYSFIYLLLSTLSFVFGDDVGITVFFVFNILCLFDLSRTMINCYYDPNRKKKKIVKEFIKKIEEANIKVLRQDSERESDEYAYEVKSTFEDFNYYINEAFNKEKISDVKEDLEVYGKLLAHIDGAVMSVNEINVFKWYCEKTYKCYVNLIKSYYLECNAILSGISNTNSQQVSATLSDIHRHLILNLVVRLANDCQDIYLKAEVYNLILSAHYINLLAIARNVDAENLDKYIIEDIDGIKDSFLKQKERKLKEISCRLVNLLKNKGETELMMAHCLEETIARTVGNVILINTDDLLILKMNFLCEDEMENKEKLIEEIDKYVDLHSQSFSAERRDKCIKRKEEVIEGLAK